MKCKLWSAVLGGLVVVMMAGAAHAESSEKSEELHKTAPAMDSMVHHEEEAECTPEKDLKTGKELNCDHTGEEEAEEDEITEESVEF